MTIYQLIMNYIYFLISSQVLRNMDYHMLFLIILPTYKYYLIQNLLFLNSFDNLIINFQALNLYVLYLIYGYIQFQILTLI